MTITEIEKKAVLCGGKRVGWLGGGGWGGGFGDNPVILVGNEREQN